MPGYSNDCLATIHQTRYAAQLLFSSKFRERIGRVSGSTPEGWSAVWITATSLTLLPSSNPESLFAEVRLASTTRREGSWNEAKGDVVLRVPIRREVISSDGGARVLWALDFSGVEAAACRMEIDEPSFRAALLAALVPALRAAGTIPISPSVPASMNPSAGIYGRGRSTVIVALVIFLLPPSVLPKQVEVTETLGAQLRVNEPMLMLGIRGELVKNNLIAPPEHKYLDTPLTFLERLDVVFRDGSITVDGRVRIEMLAFDHVFDLGIILHGIASNDAVEFRVVNTSLDSTSALYDLAEFFSGGAIGELVSTQVTSSMGAVAGSAINPRDLLGALGAGIEPATVVAQGDVVIRPDGIGVPLVVDSGSTSTAAKAPYFRGHRTSREVHVPDGCGFGRSIAKKNLREFATAEQAVASGFDGCASCLSRFNNWDEGRAHVIVSGPDDGTIPRVILRIAEGTTRSGVDVGALEETIALTLSGRVRGVAVFEGVATMLVPGEWDVDNRWGSHQHVQRVSIVPVQRSSARASGTRLNYLRSEDRLDVQQV